MTVSLVSIVEVLKSKNIKFDVEGIQDHVEAMAALDSGVENSLCYYVGSDPGPLAGVRASIIICKPGMAPQPGMDNAYIFTEHPQLAFYHASSLFEEKQAATVHEQAIIDKNAKIGTGASIGAFCVIEECRIGNNVMIESGVKIQKGTVIGNDVHIQSGTVIGAAGVMWAWDGDGNKVMCAQTGNVVIGDDVAIGSNISIVRGAFPNKPTVIGNGTMIAHGTMIGHGVMIGARNHFANNISLAGSVTIGDNTFWGSGAVARPHVKIASGTVVGAGAVMVKDVSEEGQVWMGNPARPMSEAKRNLSGVPVQY